MTLTSKPERKRDTAAAKRTLADDGVAARHPDTPPGVPLFLQPKLPVSQLGDAYEQEADRVADQVMGAHGPAPQQQPVQATDSVATAVPPVVHEALHSPGRPLEPDAQGFMESRMGHDFSRVRVHTDERAAEAASGIGARAFTADRDIVFGAGEYAPQTEPGRRLLSHELAHVVQQRAGIQRDPDTLQERANKVARELQTAIDGATWKEIRKRVYPKESAAGVKRAKERKAGTLADLTGLGRIKTLEHFASAVRDIQKKWAKLTPDERVKELGKAADAELADADVPAFLVVDKKQMEARGQFNASEWKFSISEALVDGGSLSDDAAADVSNATLHESRHAEQHFLAARFSAGTNKKDAAEIVADHGIPKVIADKAVEKKFDTKTDSGVAALGKEMYQAHVTDRARKQSIITDDGRAELATKRSDAETALKNLKAGATEQTIADAIAKCNALRAQITVVEQKYTLYRNLPSEADAHEVGDAAEQAFRGWP